MLKLTEFLDKKKTVQINESSSSKESAWLLRRIEV